MINNASYWKSNTPAVVTVISGADAIIKATFKKRGSSVALAKISGEPVYRGDNVWEYSMSFQEGEYLIFLSVNNVETVHLIKVISEIEYSNFAASQVIISEIVRLQAEIETLRSEVRTRQTLKIVG